MTGDALAQILANLTTLLTGLDGTIYTVSAVIGVAFVGHGLLLLLRSATNRQGRGFAFVSLAIGILLFSLEAFLSAASLSLFEQEAGLFSELSKVHGHGIMTPYIRFAVTVVVLVGIFSMIKGLLQLREASIGREEMLWSALTHLFAGILCVNIVTFARLFGASAGGIVQDVIETLFS